MLLLENKLKRAPSNTCAIRIKKKMANETLTKENEFLVVICQLKKLKRRPEETGFKPVTFAIPMQTFLISS